MISKLNKLTPYVRQLKQYTSSGSPMGFIDPDHSFTLVTKGGGVYVLEGVEYEIRSGDLIFYPPYMHHVIKPTTPIEQLIIHFDPFYDSSREGRDIYMKLEYNSFKEFLEDEANAVEKLLAEGPFVITLSESLCQTIKEHLEQGLKVHRENLESCQIFLKGLVLELIYHFRTTTGQNPDRKSFETKQWEKLEDVISYIHKQYNQTITLEKSATIVGVSRTYFSRLFKEYMGVNFHQYIMDLRIEKAKGMMMNTEFNFTEIADMNGFANIHHFSTSFKKHEGCTPTQYKKSVHF